MSSRIDPSSNRTLEPAELHGRLAPVLADLAFPAVRWQVLTAGDLYGCDSVTRMLLERLPERRYGAITELVAVLAAVLAGQYVPATADRSGRHPGAVGPRPPRAAASGVGGPRVVPAPRARPQPAA